MKRVFEFEGCEEEPEIKRATKSLTKWPVCAPTPQHHWTEDYGSQSPMAEQEVEADIFPSNSKDNDASAHDFYDQFIARTAEQCAEEGAAPQRSLLWKNARRFSITASDFGAALGTNAYSSPDDLVKKKVWDTFVGNQATKWGCKQEKNAAEAFGEWAKSNIAPDAELHEFNLLKFSAIPWIAVSPDGFVTYTDQEGNKVADLVEYKCPTRTQTETHPYERYDKSTPPYYRDQMMGICGYLNSHGGATINGTQFILRHAWFVVWQPQKLWIVMHSVDEDEWARRIFPGLRSWYFKKLLPAFVWRHNNRLEKDEIVPSSMPIEL